MATVSGRAVVGGQAYPLTASYVLAGAGYRPTEADVGPDPARGALDSWGKSLTLGAGTYEGIDFGGSIRVQDAADVTLTDCKWRGAVFLGPGGYHLTRGESSGNTNFNSAYRDMVGIRIERHRAAITASDGFDFFSTDKGMVRDVAIDGMLISGMTFPADSTSHGDCMQIRGVDGFTMRNADLDCGPWQPQKNSAFYGEDVAEGMKHLLLEDVWLARGGYTFRTNAVTDATARRVHIYDGGHWGSVEKNAMKGWTFEDVTGPDGSPISAP